MASGTAGDVLADDFAWLEHVGTTPDSFAVASPVPNAGACYETSSDVTFSYKPKGDVAFVFDTIPKGTGVCLRSGVVQDGSVQTSRGLETVPFLVAVTGSGRPVFSTDPYSPTDV
jgi:hypothetical protein